MTVTHISVVIVNYAPVTHEFLDLTEKLFHWLKKQQLKATLKKKVNGNEKEKAIEEGQPYRQKQHKTYQFHVDSRGDAKVRWGDGCAVSIYTVRDRWARIPTGRSLIRECLGLPGQ